jgi:hypothetical protein
VGGGGIFAHFLGFRFPVGLHGVLLSLDEPQKLQAHLLDLMEKVTRQERKAKEEISDVSVLKSQLESTQRRMRFLQADLLQAHRELLGAKKMLHALGVIDWVTERTRLTRPSIADRSLVDILAAWFADNPEIASAAAKRAGMEISDLAESVADTHNFLIKGDQYDPDEREAVLIGRPLTKKQGVVLEEICKGLNVPFRVTVYPRDAPEQ